MKALRIEKTRRIAELILDRPPVNAMDGEVLAELAQACACLERDNAVHGVLVRGEGLGGQFEQQLKPLTHQLIAKEADSRHIAKRPV